MYCDCGGLLRYVGTDKDGNKWYERHLWSAVYNTLITRATRPSPGLPVGRQALGRERNSKGGSDEQRT